MDKILAIGQCKLGNNATAQYYENVYGVKCTDDKSKYLDLFLWAYTNPCLEDTEDCDGGTLCNLRNIIGKLTRHCVDCKPKKYQEPVVIPNPDYTEWYGSEEYVECLTIQLEEDGWIDPMIDLCQNLNIEVSADTLCKAIAIQLSAQQIDCNMASDIQIQQACQMVINNIIQSN